MQTGSAPVMLVSRRTDLSEGVAAAFHREGIAVDHWDPQWADPARRSSRRARTAFGGAGGAATETAIFTLDAEAARALFAARHSWSARTKISDRANDICETAVTTVMARGARRVLLICDVRQLSFGQRMRAIRWTRDLLHRICYECSVNGFSELISSYAPVDSVDDTDRVADAAVEWHRGVTDSKCGGSDLNSAQRSRADLATTLA